MAADLIGSGVSKSGSPTPNPMTLIPRAFISFAFPSIAIVGEGLRRGFAGEDLFGFEGHGYGSLWVLGSGESAKSRRGYP